MLRGFGLRGSQRFSVGATRFLKLVALVAGAAAFEGALDGAFRHRQRIGAELDALVALDGAVRDARAALPVRVPFPARAECACIPSGSGQGVAAWAPRRGLRWMAWLQSAAAVGGVLWRHYIAPWVIL